MLNLGKATEFFSHCICIALCLSPFNFIRCPFAVQLNLIRSCPSKVLNVLIMLSSGLLKGLFMSKYTLTNLSHYFQKVFKIKLEIESLSFYTNGLTKCYLCDNIHCQWCDFWLEAVILSKHRKRFCRNVKEAMEYVVLITVSVSTSDLEVSKELLILEVYVWQTSTFFSLEQWSEFFQTFL